MGCCEETPPSGQIHVVGPMETQVCKTLCHGPCGCLQYQLSETTGQPFTCESGYTCVGDPDNTAFGCCDGAPDGCDFNTYCVNGDPPGCDADYACLTVGWYVVPFQEQ